MVHTDNAYVVANMSTFYTIFFPEGSQPDYGFDPDSGTAALYTIEDTVNLANYSVQNVCSISYFVFLLSIGFLQMKKFEFFEKCFTILS